MGTQEASRRLAQGGGAESIVNPPGKLHVVACALGDDRDLSPRARATLAVADLVYAEDTRRAARLLEGLGVRTRVRSCFDGNEGERAREAVEEMKKGRSVALVSEAGTPAVSDPGFRVVRAAIDAGLTVVPVPGPSAVLAALVASGLPTDRFLFAGFPPRRPGARRELFTGLKALQATLIFFESPVRVAETLSDLAAALGEQRPACLAREMTKTYEEFVREPLGALARRYQHQRPLGEVTLVVGGAVAADLAASVVDTVARAVELLREGHSPRDAARLLAAELGLGRREAYRVVLEAQQDARG